jgi:MinD-like ATPase involved in chromosome partitioning or flagellar assembly
MKSIIVYSGKGGVGKTTTSANIAKAFAEQDKKVYIIDADINTPSMGVIFGNNHPTKNIWVASTSFLYKNLIYMEKSMVRNFLRDCISEIQSIKPDYVIIDTPPSITDIHINLIEVLSISGVVIVTQPNELSRTDVNRTAFFFTEKCKDAACVVVENMYNDEEDFKYNWKLIERIPFVQSFKGSDVYDLYKDKYLNIVNQLENLDAVEVRLEAKKRMLFDESITVSDLPYFARDGRMVVSRNQIKFINLNTWPEIQDRLEALDNNFPGISDKLLSESTVEKIERLIKAFEYDNEAYFMVIHPPMTEIKLFPGEIGLASLHICEMIYGLPCVKYKTRYGEVVLFPHEVMPATPNEISIAIEENAVLTSDGRYIPDKLVLEEIYDTFRSFYKPSKDWEEIYDNTVKPDISKSKEISPVLTKTYEQSLDNKKNRKEYASSRS